MVTPAIFGLIGVAVGALITGGVDFFLQWRSEEAEQKRAKRLVADEIDAIVVGLEHIAKKGRLPALALTEEGRKQFLPVVEWPQEKAALALALSDEEWRLLGTFYYNVLGFRLQAADLGESGELNDEILDLVQREIIVGREAMKKLGLGEVPVVVVPDEEEKQESR